MRTEVTGVADRVMPAEELAGLVRQLAALRWPRPADEVDAALAGLGWRVSTASRFGAIVHTGLPYGDGRAFLQLRDGQTDDLVLDVSVEFGDSGPERAALRDAFAQVVRAVTEVLGEPSARRPGAAPEVRWRGEASTVAVDQPGPAVRLWLAANPYLDDLDRANEMEP